MVELFKALSEESRLRILSVLLSGDLCVCELEGCLNMSQSNVSRHLTALKRSGILSSFKRAQWTYYQINSCFIQEHPELWAYLEKGLRNLSTFDKDTQERQACKMKNLCGCVEPY